MNRSSVILLMFAACTGASAVAAAITPRSLAVSAEGPTQSEGDDFHFGREAVDSFGARYYDAWRLLAERLLDL